MVDQQDTESDAGEAGRALPLPPRADPRAAQDHAYGAAEPARRLRARGARRPRRDPRGAGEAARRALDPGDRARRGAQSRAGDRWSAGRVARRALAWPRALGGGARARVDAGPGAGRRRRRGRHHDRQRGDRRHAGRRALGARRGRDPSGRYVVFESTADNLSAADDDSVVNIYVRDRETGRRRSWSAAPPAPPVRAPTPTPPNPAISPGGALRGVRVARHNLSDADDDPSPTSSCATSADTTTLVSRAPDGSPADGDSGDPALSAKRRGRGLRVAGDQPQRHRRRCVHGHLHVRLRRRHHDAGQPVPAPAPVADGHSFDPSISKDGPRIAFAPTPTTCTRDRPTTSHQHLPVAASRASGSADAREPHLDDRVRSTEPAERQFHRAGDLGARRPRRLQLERRRTSPTRASALRDPDVFVRSISANKTTLVSRADGRRGARHSPTRRSPSISEDGRLVAFASSADNLSDRQTAPGTDVFVRDAAWDNDVLVSRASGADGATGQRRLDARRRCRATAASWSRSCLPCDELDRGPRGRRPVSPTGLRARAGCGALRPVVRACRPTPADITAAAAGHGGPTAATVPTGHAADGHGAGTAAHGHGAGGRTSC